MNICLITSARYPPEEGIGNYTYHLSRELLKKGNKVTIITRGEDLRLKKTDYEGITLYQAPFLPAYPFHVHIHGIFVKNLLRSICSDFDVIHYHTPLPPAIKTDKPTVTTVHTPMKAEARSINSFGPYELAFKLQEKISRVIERDLFKMSAGITTVSTSVSQELEEYGVDPKKAIVVSNGVDENLFRPVVNKRDEPYILYVGRISVRKGVPDFIESCRIISSQYPALRFKIVGKGPLYDRAVKMAESSAGADKFEFLGHVDRNRLIDLYQNATVFVVPSHYEGLPTTLLEAMACGIPVVATAVSGNLDVIEPGKNGILVPPKSPAEMTKAVSRLLEDEQLRNTMGAAARETILSKFTWDKISDNILSCYRVALNAGRI